MAQACSICTHPKRKLIEAAIASGKSNSAVASNFAIGRMAVARHKEQHMKPALLLVQQEQQQTTGLNVLSRLLRDAALIDEAFQQVWNEKSKDVELLLRVLSESRQQNKLAAEWQRDTAVDQMQERLNALEQKINDMYRARSA